MIPILLFTQVSNMFPTTIIASYSSSQLFPDILANVHSRKLLLHTPLYQSTDTAASPGSSDSHPTESSLDTNVVMILSVLLCVLTCAIGVNSIIRCARSCSSRASESNDSPSARLANTGVNKKALKMFPTITYSSELKLPGLDTDCVICLSEFAPGERVRVLPKCNHGFHIKCIDKWLMSHSSCPTCRHCLINTYKKIVNSSQTTLSELLPPPLQGGIVPVEPEDLIRNYRGIIC